MSKLTVDAWLGSAQAGDGVIGRNAAAGRFPRAILQRFVAEVLFQFYKMQGPLLAHAPIKFGPFKFAAGLAWYPEPWKCYFQLQAMQYRTNTQLVTSHPQVPQTSYCC